MGIVGEVYQRTGGRLVIIASGGISSGADVLERIEAGATTVQMSSLLFSEGPKACRRIKNELSQLVMNEGHIYLQDVVGAAHRKKRKAPRKNLWRAKDVSS